MTPTVLPGPDEAARLARLHSLAILDTEPEPMFDALARAAARVAGTPISLVSLVDAQRQWFKANHGLSGTPGTPREQAFCAHAIQTDALMEVSDARSDPRFVANPLVTGAPGICFYAGVPIVLKDGLRMGTLCVIDHVPRALTSAQREVLSELGRAAAEALELRAHALERIAALAAQAEDRARLEHILDGTRAGTFNWNVPTGETHVNERWAAIIGYTRAELEPITAATWQHFAHPDDLANSRALLALHFSGELESYDCEVRMRHRDGRWVWVHARGRVATWAPDGTPLWMFGTHLDITESKLAQLALAASEGRARASYESTPSMLHSTDAQGRLRSVSNLWLSVLGYARDEVIGRFASDFLSPASREIEQGIVMPAFVASGRCDRVPYQMIHRDGHLIDVELSAVLERDENGAPQRMAVIEDVSEGKAMERSLAESHELLRVTLQSIGDAVITTDREGRVQWLNPAAERMTGWTSDAAHRGPLEQVFRIVHEDGRAPADNPVALCLAEQRVTAMVVDTVLISRDGSERGIENSAAPIRSADGRIVGAVLVFHDVTEQRRLAREMSQRAMHDALTGLVNRTEFELRLTRLLAEDCKDGREHALMFIDLDQFKLVNDACGHAAGDQLLRQIAGVLKDEVRGRDTVARLGGDEFAIVLEDCASEAARRVGQKICDRMDSFRFVHLGRRFRVGASIGLVKIDAHWTDASSVVQAADISCLAAKEAGRNRVHVWFDTDQAMRRRNGETQWASRLEHALEEHRFELYAQRISPLQAAPQGLHCEILLRLRGEGDESGEIIAPGAFMPAAERFHMAARIDRWVLARVVDRMREHPETHDAVDTLAVNLSGQSVGDQAFHRYAAELIGSAGFDVRKLCLEITETAAITHLADASIFIEQMRALGVRIALDDFGAGASSFGYLKTLPVDVLKIDGQFVRNMVDETLDHAAVRCFQDVAKVVGVKTVAEFVEREDTLAALKAMGVDYAQGYLLHRPQPLAVVMAGYRVGAEVEL